MLDAELRLNIGLYDNRALFISTFLIRPGFEYWEGPVFHSPRDLHISGDQIFVTPPVTLKLFLLSPVPEVLKQDVHVILDGGKMWRH